jgi:molecular chaperone DnaK
MHAQEDRQRKEEIELRNRADSLAYQSERTLNDLGDKVSPSARDEAQEKINVVRDALKSNDMPRVRTAMDDLERTMQRIGSDVYSQAEAGAGTGPGSQGANSDSDTGTVEGEYREV